MRPDTTRRLSVRPRQMEALCPLMGSFLNYFKVFEGRSLSRNLLFVIHCCFYQRENTWHDSVTYNKYLCTLKNIGKTENPIQ